MDCLKQNYSDQSDLLREVLKHWLDRAVDPLPSWRTVITALRSPTVDMKRVAANLEAKYCEPVQCREMSNSSTVEREGIAVSKLFVRNCSMIYRLSLAISLAILKWVRWLSFHCVCLFQG